jgi:hypothetical protein
MATDNLLVSGLGGDPSRRLSTCWPIRTYGVVADRPTDLATITNYVADNTSVPLIFA